MNAPNKIFTYACIFLFGIIGNVSLAGVRFASPNGLDSNSGLDQQNPLSLTKALSSQSPLVPGDSLFLLDGHYKGNFEVQISGSPDRPIYILPLNEGEAWIDPSFNRTDGTAITINGDYVWLIGIHITSSTVHKREDLGEAVPYENGITVNGNSVKLINCWIYDVAGGGLQLWRPSLDLEVYGCIIFNNGTQAALRGTGHGMYIQHDDADRPKILQNNVIFQNASQGINIYTTNPQNGGIISLDNTSFNTGVIANFNPFLFRPPHNFTIGSANNFSYAMSVSGNIFYSDLQGGRLNETQVSNVSLGRTFQPNDNFEFTENFLYGGRNMVEIQPLNRFEFTKNIFYNLHGNFIHFLTDPALIEEANWDENFYFQNIENISTFSGFSFDEWKANSGYDKNSHLKFTIPTEPKVWIRQNKYDGKRFYVTIANPSKSSSVKVDFSSFGISEGTVFQIQDFQNPFDAEYKVNGELKNQLIDFPMNHQVSLAPKGNMPHEPVHTDESFGVFQVTFQDFQEKPIFRDQIALYLNEEGKIQATLKDFLENDPAENWNAEYSMGPLFTCEQLGENEVLVTISDTNGTSWKQDLLVEVKDSIFPIVDIKTTELEFDIVQGSLNIEPEMFINSISDNCGIQSVSLSRTLFTCEDLSSLPEVVLTVKDFAGNEVSKNIELKLTIIESKKVSLQANKPLYEGGTSELILGEELDFEVLAWYRNGSLLEGIKGKAIEVEKAGVYYAQLRLSSGCIVESERLQLALSEVPFPPTVEKIELVLNDDGQALLAIEDLFTSWPPSEELEITTSDLTFNCEKRGDNWVEIRIESKEGKVWEESVKVLVLDTQKPQISPKNQTLTFDPSKGEITLNPEMFVENVTDNCGIKSLTINKTKIGCEDFKEEIKIGIRAEDFSGNVTEMSAFLFLTKEVSSPVILTGEDFFCEGEASELSLNSDAAFEVVRWRKNGVEIPNQTGNSLTIEEAGIYHAVIRYQDGCIWESNDLEVKKVVSPSGEIHVDGNRLRAPEGDFTYQWYRNGEILTEATERELEVHQMGSFSVIVTNSAGCATELNPVDLTISGLPGGQQIEAEALIIYPNPSQAELILEPQGDLAFAENSWRIFDLNGRDVSASAILLYQSDQQIRLDVSTLANGTYTVWIDSQAQKIFLGRFIKLD
ncbi:T9SS type A sorting domain-containing protein [Algoriphagus vanfongensis]|uniref:T9SS type A sorting domain-containing protein n=1 Tax=Algoriphagus vanfongensis TaxID=426371 RepID=UPI00047920F3|nr:T9SS type A sorting domain-containing protein [Algoriphagus vanfongensis]